ncbi:hypothetical protein DNU06_03560 [Putridiphycobacter roseus]|uniref:PKD domain-containing protein n=1 Tax=Putridiphycobacter roseus TaxID=2219161 RepID=A0A2W1N3K8_9FLAO|nr:M43 family zinc metalloprotease [Putridiphycobacter roseus]PZE18917.1 hypothetical protein DNU06_03560 [Putridiphycobacter roseus]
MKISIFISALMLQFGIVLHAQTTSYENPIMCAEHIEREKLSLENNAYRIQDSIDQVAFEIDYQSYLSSFSADDRSTYTIPVVVHVVHLGGVENISNAQINEAIETLNIDYNMLNSDLGNTVSAFSGITGNPSFEFVLATKDPNGNCHSGITRTASSTTFDTGMSNGSHDIVDAVVAQHGIWPQKDYLSIIVCIDPNGAAGYTYRPSNFFNPNQMYGAIFMRHDYMGTTGTSSNVARHTLSHEVGHWFNLAHCWGSTNSPGVGSSCSSDDNVTDTPNTIGWSSCNTAGVSCGSLDNVQNIMEYSYCSTMFTDGQAARMQTALLNSTAGRDNLSTSANLIASGVSNNTEEICEAIFTQTNSISCAGSSIEFSDISVHNITTRAWSFPGGTPSTSTDSNVVVSYNSPGQYPVTLTVSNASNQETVTLINSISVLDVPGESLPYFEGFENQSAFPDNISFSIDNPNNDFGWEVTNSTGSTGNHSLFLNNYSANGIDVDKFISGAIDLGNLTANHTVAFEFKYAYHKKDALDDEYLKFFVSNDCGETWVLRKSIHGSFLNSNVQNSSYAPADEDWKTVVVNNINDVYFVPNFRYKFEFSSSEGNNIYIDDINIVSPDYVGLDGTQNEGLAFASLYPNPTNGNSNLTLRGYDNMNISVTLYDINGARIQEMINTTVTNDNLSLQLETASLAKGVYLVNIKSDNKFETLKLIKQ